MNVLEKYAAKKLLTEKLAGFLSAKSYKAGKGLVNKVLNARKPSDLAEAKRQLDKLPQGTQKSVMDTINSRARTTSGVTMAETTAKRNAVVPKNLIELASKEQRGKRGLRGKEGRVARHPGRLDDPAHIAALEFSKRLPKQNSIAHLKRMAAGASLERMRFRSRKKA